MPKLSKKRLESVLTHGLRLAEPQFVLERDGARFHGSIISPTFRGKTDLKRQTMILDTLEKALGQQYLRMVGLLLAYTPDEWNVDLDAYHRPRTRSRRNGWRSPVTTIPPKPRLAALSD